MTERKEAWFRILVLLISGIIIVLWGALIRFVFLIHWIYVVFKGRRSRKLAEFCEIWNTQFYVFLRYTTFVSNERPFPFRDLTKSFSKFGK